MRHVINILLVMMAGGCIAIGVRSFTEHRELQEHVESTREALYELKQRVALHSTVEEVAKSSNGFPESIDPDWFPETLPLNHLVSENRPWLEIAGEEDRNKRHPDQRATIDSDLAAFWYNPYNGVIRARVPRSISDSNTNQLYDQVNNITKEIVIDPNDVTYERAKNKVERVRRSSGDGDERTVTRRNNAARQSNSKKRTAK